MSTTPRLLACRLDGQPLPDGGDAWIEDRGLHYGDGLFETMIVRGGRVRFEALHQARFAEGCRRLWLRCDPDTAFAEVRDLAALTGEAVLKLIVTRGTARIRGYAPAGDEQPRRLLLAYPAPQPGPGTPPFTLRLIDALYGENPQLAGLKHLNRLEQVLARAETQRLGVDEGLVRSSSGRLVSGTMSNVFILDGTDLLTPSLARCGIAGVTRAVVLREAPGFGFATRENDIDPSRLAAAGAVLVCNVRLGLRIATRLDDRQLPPPPPALQALSAHLATLDA
jgi:4-amino-4-deoxychorismate lyase